MRAGGGYSTAVIWRASPRGPSTLRLMPARRRAADISRGLGGGTADGHAPLVRRPEIDFHLDVRFTTDRMKIALVAGVRPRDDCRLWLVVGRAEAHTPTLAAARLYAFTRAGCDAANAEAKALQAHLKCDGDWISFVWRVLVEGPWERPMAVTPVWVLDGCDHPINVKYYFD